MPLMHHQKTVSVLYGEPEIMCDHNGRQVLFCNDLSGQFHNNICRLRVEGGRVLIKNQKFDGSHG